MLVDPDHLAKSIDHTILRPEATQNEIKKVCEEGKRYKFASVVVSPSYVKFASELLEGTTVKVGTVVGFPFGETTTSVKCFEAINNIMNGATEIDFVMNISYMKSQHYDDLFQDIRAVVLSCKRQQFKNSNRTIISKVIIETCYLTDEEKKLACKIIEKAGADFIKTSTGYGPKGATEEDVKLLRRNIASQVGVKASGGIRTLGEVLAMLDVGASRIGTSAGAAIMKECLSMMKVKD